MLWKHSTVLCDALEAPYDALEILYDALETLYDALETLYGALLCSKNTL